MEKSTFTPEELTRWKTLEYVCTNDSNTFKDLLSVTPDNVLNGVVNNKNLLFIACKTPNESVKHLLDCERFTVESINANNQGTEHTALREACAYHPRAVKYLLDSKRFTDESINKINCQKNTALTRACLNSLESVRYLLESNRLSLQTINLICGDGQTALHCACRANTEIVKYLLNNDKLTNSTINAKSASGNSVLHFACENKNAGWEMIECLLSCNKLTLQTINSLNDEGLTALDLARKHQPKEIVDQMANLIRKLNDDASQNDGQNLELAMINLQLENAELKRQIAQMELKFL